jgi:hypothetical protein
MGRFPPHPRTYKERNVVEDLKTRIKALLNEIEFTHLKKDWTKRLTEVGIDEGDASKWAAEIGHVVDEYQSSLIRLVDLLQESDPRRIPQRIHGWAVGRLEVTIPEIEDPMRYLERLVEKYLPPEPDDEDEPS